MKDIAEAGAGILLAFVLYTIFSKISASLYLALNVFSLAVVYFALTKGEIAGVFIGTLCGLIQDSFSLGVFGVAGLSKTLLGYFTGSISRKIDVTPFGRNFFFLLVLSSLELIVWGLLYSFVFSMRLNTGGGWIFLQPLLTALLGSCLFQWKRRMKDSGV